MKNPLHYQLSEYDCGPTSMLNAINYLFEREEIPPEVIRNIMLYCLDCYSTEGIPGKSGTSCAAMMFLSSWLNSLGSIGLLPVSCRYLSDQSVYIGRDSLINDALRRGGVVVVRLFLDEWHYVLLTGENNGAIFLFDPYLEEEEYTEPGVITDRMHIFSHNRIVPFSYFNELALKLYALGPVEGREAVILFNENKKLTADKTIEYFI
ncbi:MAG: peptidase C39 [Lachnospiraceae bacterium]|nr:peptidase C39 [Lachnospiraceae bacterium]